MAEVLEPVQIHTRPALEMNDDQFFQFCQANPEHRLERTAGGDIIVMSPESASSGHGNFILSGCFAAWDAADRSGTFFSSSTGFILPNGAMRSPDISWVRNDRLQNISPETWRKFLPLCPDFVLELRSPSDRLGPIEEKLEEYIANGTRLGWLLDPVAERVHIYRPNTNPQILDQPLEILGDPVLPGFRLPVPKIWAAINRRF